VLAKIKSVITGEKDVLSIRLPRHITITLHGIQEWVPKNNISYEEAYKKSFLILNNIIQSQIKLKIPILSFYVLDADYDREGESYAYLLDSIVEMLNELSSEKFVHENKVKISVIGKWYNLPSRVVDAIKKVIEETKDYDGFFVNLCINYNGQEEIVNAVKLLGMQIKAGKMDPELIDKELIKENIYTSYFLPPNLMIKNGSSKETSGFLLWDSINTKIYFTNKLWPDFDDAEFTDAIKEYQKGS
jgi:undecaprenyl diphosphate synthase